MQSSLVSLVQMSNANKTFWSMNKNQHHLEIVVET